MATITAAKTVRTLIAASTSNAAAGTTSAVWADGTGGSVGALAASPEAGTIVGQVVNPGSGLTTGATVTVNVLVGGTVAASPVWRQHFQATYLATASATYPFETDLPRGATAAQVVVSGNAGAAVTCDAFGLEVTNYVSA